MFGQEWSALVFGLSAAASWGAGDFSGGLATRRAGVYSVIVGSQAVSALGLLVVALLLGEALPAWPVLLIAGVGGIAGGLGLVAFYTALAEGDMGPAAPISAVVTGSVPVMVGLAVDGLPGPSQMIGFALAAVGVWLIAGVASQRGGKISREMGLAALSGVGFGVLFVCLDLAGGQSAAVFWPLLAARIASLSVLTTVAARRGQALIPPRNRWALIALIALTDTAGNVFFIWASQSGRLDIAATLGSLYPAATVLLARQILRERLTRQQWWGVVAALGAVVLIAG